jgi:hypothetical protein
MEAAVIDTLALYDVYICGECRLIVGRRERHLCKAPLTRRDEDEH